MSEIRDFREYALAIESVARYPGAGEGSVTALTYVALGIAGEAGEFADKVKKILRDDASVISLEAAKALIAELGDVLWYVSRAATELGVPLSLVAEGNVKKLYDRRDRNVLGGSGDNR